MNQLLKWGAFGGAAIFFLWDSIKAALPDTGAEQPTAAPTPASPVYYPPGVNTTLPPAAVSPTAPPAHVAIVPVTDDTIKRATWDLNTALLLGDRVLYNAHQWNWYRENSGGGRTNPGTDLSMYGADPNTPITAVQYLERLSQHGIGGLRGLRGARAGAQALWR